MGTRTDRCLSAQGQEPPGLQDEEAARLLVACSGKMAMLAAMLPRLLSDGHRVLIFSQLKGVLTLLEVRLLLQHIPCSCD